MIVSDSQREENYQEYLRLKKDPNYYDVTFDDKSGGVSAIHRNHKFDSEMGAYGIRIGEYERNVVEILRKRGHFITLESEIAPNGVKTPDGYLDGFVMDIKSTEGHGKWAIKDKLHSAAKQGAECAILYFHDKSLFSTERVDDGWRKYTNDEASQKHPQCIKRIICVVENEAIDYRIP